MKKNECIQRYDLEYLSAPLLKNIKGQGKKTNLKDYVLLTTHEKWLKLYSQHFQMQFREIYVLSFGSQVHGPADVCRIYVEFCVKFGCYTSLAYGFDPHLDVVYPIFIHMHRLYICIYILCINIFFFCYFKPQDY